MVGLTEAFKVIFLAYGVLAVVSLFIVGIVILLRFIIVKGKSKVEEETMSE